jgi:hypothetical protein
MRRCARLMLLILALTASASPNMHIVVNGKTLPQSAIAIIDNKVYAAVRAIGEPLGAYVTANPVQHSVTVTTLLRQAVLYVDSPRALLNGETITLSAPPRRVGANIMLPLRAIATVFGASVTYKPSTHAVIVSAPSRAVASASASPIVLTKTYAGTVLTVNNALTPPSIQFVSQGHNYSATIPASTPIEFRDVRGAMTGQGTLSAVRPGDALIVTLDASGHLVSIADIFASMSGTIASVADESMVLTSGRVISVNQSATATVTLDGRPVSFDSLQAGDKVTVRADPVSGAVRDVVALTPGGYATTATATPNSQAASSPPVTITNVTDNAQHAFGAGSLLKVTLDGTAGARAEFDLSDVFAANPMREVTPGRYEGQYNVAVGTNITSAPVLVRLTKNGLTALAEAPHAVTIITTPPSVGEVEPSPGTQINIARPNILATFVTVGETGMDVTSYRLLVNGQDVTGGATRTPSFISYYPPTDLPSGVVNVSIKGTDIAGNGLEYQWAFKIVNE